MSEIKTESEPRRITPASGPALQNLTHSSNTVPMSPCIAITSDTVVKSEDCQSLGIEALASPELLPGNENENDIPIVRPEPNPPKPAVMESFMSQEEVASRQEMKMTSRPTSSEELPKENDQGGSSTTRENSVSEKEASQPVVPQTSTAVDPLFLSGRARKLMRMKQQAMTGGPRPSTPITSPQIASKEPSQVKPPPAAPVQVNTQPASGLVASGLSQLSSLYTPPPKEEPKKQKKPKEKRPEQPNQFIRPQYPGFNHGLPSAFMEPRQLFMQSLPDDLEPSLYTGVLPKFSELGMFDSSGSAAFTLEEYSSILFIAEFLRLVAPDILVGWPSVLVDPHFLELVLLVPNDSFSPMYPFIVSHLVRLLREGGEFIKTVDLQDAVTEILKTKVILLDCTPIQKVDVLSQLIELVMDLPWFSKFLDNKLSLGVSLVQKRRDLMIAHDSCCNNLQRINVEIAQTQKRAQYIKEQADLTPENTFIGLQLNAVNKQVAANLDQLRAFEANLAEIKLKLQEVDLAECDSPDAALIHGRLEGPIPKSFATLLGKDRIGRLFWFWRHIGGIFIEATPCYGLNYTAETPRWEYIGDEEQLKNLEASLNLKGIREFKLYSQISKNRGLIVDSFYTCIPWLQFQKELRGQSAERLIPFLKTKLANFSPHMTSLQDSFLAKLKEFGYEDLLSIADRQQYEVISLRIMRERLAKLKLYLFDQSALLLEDAQLSNTSQRLLNALHTSDSLEKGAKAAHEIFDSTLPLLEACKTLDVPLTPREKDLKRSLNILLTWIKTSPFFKDILLAATDDARAKFPTTDHFCAWLMRVIIYLADLHQEDIEEGTFIPAEKRKFRGLKTLPCRAHSSQGSCHYHYHTLPKGIPVEVIVPCRPKSDESEEETLAASPSPKKPRTRGPIKPAFRRSGRATKPINYALDAPVSYSESSPHKDSELRKPKNSQSKAKASSASVTPRRSSRNAPKDEIPQDLLDTSSSDSDLPLESVKKERKNIAISDGSSST